MILQSGFLFLVEMNLLSLSKPYRCLDREIISDSSFPAAHHRRDKVNAPIRGFVCDHL